MSSRCSQCSPGCQIGSWWRCTARPCVRCRRCPQIPSADSRPPRQTAPKPQGSRHCWGRGWSKCHSTRRAGRVSGRRTIQTAWRRGRCGRLDRLCRCRARTAGSLASCVKGGRISRVSKWRVETEKGRIGRVASVGRAVCGISTSIVQYGKRCVASAGAWRYGE